MRLNITRGAFASAVLALAAAGASAGVNQLTSVGPEGGRVMDVAFHPTSPDVLYLAASSGFHRSSDGGLSWRLTKSDFLSAPTDVAVDPTDADRVYLAAWEELFVSADGGHTFLRTFPPGFQGFAFRVECARDGAVYASDGAKMYASTDQGRTWELRGAFPQGREYVYAIAVDPSDPKTIYVASFSNGIFVSRDAGVSWQSVGAQQPDLLQTMSLKIDPSNAQRLWAGTTAGLYRTDDSGANWMRVLNSYTDEVAIDPGDSQTVFAAPFGPSGVFTRSTDAGATWHELPHRFGERAVGRYIIDPAAPSRRFAFAGDGLFRSRDGGAAWVRTNAGLIATEIRRVAPLRDGRSLYIGTAASGVFSLGAGDIIRPVNNAQLGALSSTGSLHIVDLVATRGAAAHNLFVIFGLNEIARSLDGGANWTRIAWPSSTARPWTLAASDGATAVLYVATMEGVFSSADFGDSWTPRNAGLPAAAQPSSLVLAPTNSQVVYLNIADGAATKSFKTVDGGQVWTEIAGRVSVLGVHPSDETMVFGADGSSTSMPLLRSIDGGGQWMQVSTDSHRAHSIAFDAADPDVIYASGNQGVARSTDRGATWERLSVLHNFFAFSTSLAAAPGEPDAVLVGSNGFGLRHLAIRPDVHLSLTAPGAMTAGAVGSFALQVRNRGPYQARDVRVSIQLPASATQIAASSGDAACSVNAQEATCTVATLKTDAVFTVNVSAVPPAAGTFSVQASATATEGDADTSNNAVSASVAVSATPPPSGGGGGGGGGALSLLMLCALAALGFGVLTRRS